MPGILSSCPGALRQLVLSCWSPNGYRGCPRVFGVSLIKNAHQWKIRRYRTPVWPAVVFPI
jgi:hypothetical protein